MEWENCLRKLSRKVIKHKVAVDAIKFYFEREIQQSSNNTTCGKYEKKVLGEGMKHLVL